MYCYRYGMKSFAGMLEWNRKEFRFERVCNECGSENNLHEVKRHGVVVDLCTHCAVEVMDDELEMNKLVRECKQGVKS